MSSLRLARFALVLSIVTLAAVSTPARAYPPVLPAGNFTDPQNFLIPWYASKRPADFSDATPIVVAMHGFKDNAFNYTENADDPLLRGLGAKRWVVAFNQPTFGERTGDGEPPNERVVSVREFADRYGSFVREIAAKYPRNPIVLEGHSLGGLVVATYVVSYARELPANVKAALLSAPALGLSPRLTDKIKGAVVRLAALIPGLRKAPALPDFLDAAGFVEAESLSYLITGQGEGSRAIRVNRLAGTPDSEALERFRADPLIRNRLHTIESAAATINGMRELRRTLDRLDHALPIPFAVAHHDHDQITAPEASYAFVARERELEKRDGTPYRSTWRNGTQADGGPHVRLRTGHGLPGMRYAPPALDALFAENADIYAAFGKPERTQGPVTAHQELRNDGIRFERSKAWGLPRIKRPIGF